MMSATHYRKDVYRVAKTKRVWYDSIQPEKESILKVIGECGRIQGAALMAPFYDDVGDSNTLH